MEQKRTKQAGRPSGREGSALIWAMLVIMILTVIVTAALTFGLAYVNRSLANNARQQAYFTARSAVDLLVEQCNDETAAASLLPSAVGETVTVEDMGFEQRMGTCSATIERIEVDSDTPSEAGTPKKEQRLVVTATATVRGQTYTMHAVAGVVEGEIPDPPPIDPDPVDPEPTPPTKFGIGVYTESNAQGGNSVSSPFTLTGNTDYFFDTKNLDPLSLTSGALIEGNLLSRHLIELSSSYGEKQVHIAGWCISDDYINITSNGPQIKIDQGVYCLKTATINDYNGKTVEIGEDVIADMVLITGSPTIHGKVKANKVTLNTGAIIEGDIFTADGLVHDISGKSYAEWNGKPIKKIAEQPFTPKSVLSKEVILPSLDTPSGTEAYSGVPIDTSAARKNYTINRQYNQNMVVSGKNPVVFYLGSQARVTVNQITQQGQETTPVYFILQPGSQLDLATGRNGSLTSNVHVIGEGAQLNLGDSTYSQPPNPVTLQGSIVVKDTALHIYAGVTIAYRDPIEEFIPEVVPADATLMRYAVSPAAASPESTPAAAQTDAYQIGVYAGDNLGDSGSSSLTNTLTIGADTDFYYHGTKPLTVGNSQKEVWFHRNVLSNSPAPVTFTGQTTTVDGSVIAQGDVIVDKNAKISKGIHTTGTVTVQNGGEVRGGITAKHVVIQGGEVHGMISTTGNRITYNGRELTSPPYGSTFTMSEAGQITSRVPAYQIKTPKLPDDAIEFKSNMTLGNANGTDSFYHVKSTVYLGGQMLKVQGSGNIYIFIDGQDAKLNIGGINLASDQKKNPNVYFVLLNGGNLNIGTEKFHRMDTDVHIIAPEKAGEIYLGSGVELNGSVIVEEASKLQINENVTINYKPSEFDPIIPDDGGGEIPPGIVWKILWYGRDEYDA